MAMRPRIFIGSSGKSKQYAEAIHSSLEEVAECTPWTQGAFDLDSSTLGGLIENLQDSDFGVFVFAADDTADIKGSLLNIPRDNVVYEAGLFSGYLAPERCFIVLPRSTSVHLPTDLSGRTVGYYDDKRTDKNDDSAVLTFCRAVKKQITEKGLFQGNIQETLRELVTQFECCHWIAEEDKRIRQKKAVASQVDQFCKTNRLNKHRLLARHRPGYYLALLHSIKNQPEKGDCRLILQMQLKHLPKGFAYHQTLDAIEPLIASGCCEPSQVIELKEWLNKLPDASPVITDRIARLSAH